MHVPIMPCDGHTVCLWSLWFSSHNCNHRYFKLPFSNNLQLVFLRICFLNMFFILHPNANGLLPGQFQYSTSCRNSLFRHTAIHNTSMHWGKLSVSNNVQLVFLRIRFLNMCFIVHPNANCLLSRQHPFTGSLLLLFRHTTILNTSMLYVFS